MTNLEPETQPGVRTSVTFSTHTFQLSRVEVLCGDSPKPWPFRWNGTVSEQMAAVPCGGLTHYYFLPPHRSDLPKWNATYVCVCFRRWFGPSPPSFVVALLLLLRLGRAKLLSRKKMRIIRDSFLWSAEREISWLYYFIFFLQYLKHSDTILLLLKSVFPLGFGPERYFLNFETYC